MKSRKGCEIKETDFGRGIWLEYNTEMSVTRGWIPRLMLKFLYIYIYRATAGSNFISHPTVKMNSFPVELLIRIFAFLTQEELTGLVALVCRRWRSLIYDRDLWRKMKIWIRTPSQVEGCRTLIHRCAPHIKELTIETDPNMGLNVEELLEGIPSFPCLVHLDMEYCNTDELSTCIRQIMAQAPVLERVALPSPVGFPLRDLRSIPEWITLRSLNLNRVFTNLWYRQPYDVPLMRDLLEICPRLETLIMDTSFYYGINNKVLQIICPHPTLCHLSVVGREMTNASLSLIATCPQLKKLKITSGSDGMTDQALSCEFPSGLTVLKLNLRRASISSVALNTFFGQPFLRGLRQVQLQWCNITDAGLTILAMTCSDLQIMDLRYSNHPTYIGVSALLNRCLNLHSLFLEGNVFVNWSFLDLVLTHPRLTHLRIVDCGLIPYHRLTELQEQMPHLRLW